MPDTPKVTLTLKFPVSNSPAETLERINKITKSPAPISERSTKAILFLRAASGRATLSLSAFYLFLAAQLSTDSDRKAWAYSQRVKHYTLRFSSVNTIALSARTIFDHSSKNELCAKTILSANKSDLQKIASFWSNRTGREYSDAEEALLFVKDILEQCAIPINSAKKSPYVLARRIAFMKALADRESAHISLHEYEYTFLDVAHVVAATALLGAVIYHFDHPRESGAKHFEALDIAAHEGASDVFPQTKKLIRLFENNKFEEIIKTLLKGKMMPGHVYLSEYLPSVLGLDGMPRDFVTTVNAINNKNKSK